MLKREHETWSTLAPYQVHSIGVTTCDLDLESPSPTGIRGLPCHVSLESPFGQGAVIQ